MQKLSATYNNDVFLTLSSDLFCIAGSDGYLKFVNKSWEALLGYSSEELMSRPYLDFVHPEDRHRTLAEANRCFICPGNGNFENRYVCRDGSYRILLWNSWPHPQNKQVYAIARDISDLRWQSRMADQTNQAAQIGGWEYDVSARKLTWTEETYRLHDMAPRRGGISVERALSFYSERSQVNVRRAFQGALRTGEPYDLEVELTTAKGRPIWVRTSGRSEMLEGRVLKLYGSFQDITESKRQQRALEESEERLRMALLSAHMGMWELRLINDEMIWNEQAKTIFEMIGSSDRFSLKQFLGAFVPEDQIAFRKKLALVSRGHNEEEFYLELRIHTSLSRHKWVAISGRLLRGKNGGAERIIGVIRDISKERSLKEQLAQSQKLESIGLLAGGIAHDFNNLLSVILGHAESLKQKAEEFGLGLESVNKIWSAAQRAADLTRRLLSFSRQDAAHAAILNLNDLVTEAQEMLDVLVGENIQWKMDLCSPPTRVFSDAGQLLQVLTNLVLNARDAMPQGGQIQIGTRRAKLAPSKQKEYRINSSDVALLTIRDTGEGIEPTNIPRIFEPFYTTKAKGKGTGLGLSVVYGIVKQYGGHIQVESERYVGTTFRVYLPLARPAAAAEPYATAVGIRAEDRLILSLGSSRRILIVEDEEDVRQLIADVLKGEGHEVVCRQDGASALQILEANSGGFDLVVSDLIMPGLSGLEFRKKCHEKWPQIRFLFLSGYADRGLFQNGGHITYDDFLQKPFIMKNFRQKVCSLLQVKSS